MSKISGIVNSTDSNIRIHNEAIMAAKQAAKDYMDKHGEPMYCGFAWVNIQPATSKFCRALKAHGLADHTSYYTGYDIWAPCGTPTQSMDVKEAGADAYAKVLGTYGIKATMMSRAD